MIGLAMIASRARCVRFAAVILTHLAVEGDGAAHDAENHSFRTGWPICTGEVDGVKSNFMLVDTGSTGCAVDRNWASRNFKGRYSISSIRVLTAVGEERLAAFRGVPFAAMGLSARELDLAVMDFSGFEAAMDHHMNAIVGMSVLRDRCIEFDEKNGCKILEVVPDLGSNDSVFPLRNGPRGPEIEVVFPGLGKRWLFIDTGSNGGIGIKKQKMSMLDRMGHVVKYMDMEAVAGQGESSTRAIRVMRSAEVGDIRFLNVLVDEIAVETIGLGILHRFRMILDFPGERAILRYRGDGDVCHLPRNASGMAVNIKRNGRIGIHRILKDSPAAVLGLKPSEEITRIDGLDPGSLGYWQLQELLSEAGKTISLRVLRDGQETEMKMTLRHTIPFPPEFPPEKPEFNPEP